MLRKAGPARDAYTFSLGGMQTISSVVIAPAIADDQLTHVRKAKRQQAAGGRKRRIWNWLPTLRPSAPGNCA